MKKLMLTIAMAAAMGAMMVPVKQAEAASIYFVNNYGNDKQSRWEGKHNRHNQMIQRSVRHSLVESTRNPMWRDAVVKIVRERGSISRVVVILPQGF
ncbi:hypothetical protein Mmc1_0190 [Magnetococcus marinus MC-1]|uniref:Uncharacterized protein n=1 Tax=Magnetococcus marinus (strain ATCC BAA-1437 / JCM 17883 / MC-1) TaxID=156889 RepID=A0L424_MAGMM|nr:hypothetical protein [Magnetococcus marinus]ABK42717.1 hypothetical protein Mmc1_0190 [Magnetococcus marinus MC-1]